jgi:hypothetical protein
MISRALIVHAGAVRGCGAAGLDNHPTTAGRAILAIETISRFVERRIELDHSKGSNPDRDPIAPEKRGKNMKHFLIATAVLLASSLSVLAQNDNNQGQNNNNQGQNNSNQGNYRGAPGPIAGAGLPVLAVGFGVYWLIKRRRKAIDRRRR